jgi:phage I-like protein
VQSGNLFDHSKGTLFQYSAAIGSAFLNHFVDAGQRLQALISKQTH